MSTASCRCRSRRKELRMSSIAMSSSMPRTAQAVKRGRFALVGLATVLAATLANVLVYYIGGTLVAYDPRFDILVNVGPAISVTLTFAFVAVLIYAAVLRVARNPVRVYTVIAAVIFVVTL